MDKVPHDRYETAYEVFTQIWRAAHIALGLTQARAAALIEKAQPWLSCCESGDRRVDVVETLLFAMANNQPSGYFTDGVLQSRPRRKRKQS